MSWFCFPVFAETKRLSVLEFRGVDIEPSVLLKLSDQVRAAAIETLPKNEYLILTRENMLQVLSDMGKDASCMEGTCEVEIGRNIGADIIVAGDILKMGEVYVLTLKLYETKTGSLLMVQEVENSDVFALKNATYEQSKILFQEGLGLQEQKSGFSLDRGDWITGGLALVSASLYGATVTTYNAYESETNFESSEKLYKLNNIAHTSALSLTGVMILYFGYDKFLNKGDKKKEKTQ